MQEEKVETEEDKSSALALQARMLTYADVC
jgi:hypothetical protein